jgi:hypothetical protein
LHDDRVTVDDARDSSDKDRLLVARSSTEQNGKKQSNGAHDRLMLRLAQ